MESRIDYYIMNTSERTPDELSRIAIELLGIKRGESVADLCCCEGAFLNKVASEFENVELYGSDINIDYCDKAKRELERLNTNFEIECKNMFDVDLNQKFDKIFVHPPFGMASKGNTSAMQFFHNQFPDAETVANPCLELMCIRLTSLMISKKGKAVIFAPLSTTFKPSDKLLRQSIVKGGCLKTVVRLPSEIFGNTVVKGVAYIVEKSSSGVEFINDKDSRIVSEEEVKNHRFDLNPETYLLKPLIFENPDHLGNVCYEILRSNLARSKKVNGKNIGNRVIYSIKIANMEDGLVSLEKATDEEFGRAVNGIRLKKHDILISRVTSPVNAAIFEYDSDVEAYAHNNIYVLRADETKVNPYYLCAFFNSNQGAEVLVRKGLGSHMPVISIKDLRELEIPLPSIKEQNELAKQFKERCEKVKLLKKELKCEKDKIKKMFQKC